MKKEFIRYSLINNKEYNRVVIPFYELLTPGKISCKKGKNSSIF